MNMSSEDSDPMRQYMQSKQTSMRIKVIYFRESKLNGNRSQTQSGLRPWLSGQVLVFLFSFFLSLRMMFIYGSLSKYGDIQKGEIKKKIIVQNFSFPLSLGNNIDRLRSLTRAVTRQIDLLLATCAKMSVQSQTNFFQ